TTATDSGTWFPLPQRLKAAAAGRIGEVAPRFFGAPTNRSHRVTIDVDAPDILARCQADKVDVAVIVPNCPVCHQTSTLVARHLEANGIATVVMGCAKDIVEHAAAPRFLFSDFPLGNSAGKPHDVASQALTLELALRLLESAPGARTTMQSSLRWSEDASWKLDYNTDAQMSAEELARGRRHQGGAPRRRGHAPHAAEPRMGRARPRAGLAGHQRQQAQPHPRPLEAGGDRHRQAARRASRRGDGELSSRRDGQARHRLCRSLRDQSAADLLRDFRFW